jgi:hypothetical protein
MMSSSVSLLLLTGALAGAKEDITGEEGEGISNGDQLIREQLNKEVI